MGQPLLMYWRVLMFFWTGGKYAEVERRFGLSRYSRAHLYSLASVPWLMSQPHYRAGTFQEDMRTNLRNVVLPTGLYGLPLSICARSKGAAVLTGLFLIPTAAFWGAFYR